MINLAHISTMLGVIALLILIFFVIREVQHDLRKLVSGKCVVLLGIIVWYLFEAVSLPSEIQTMTQDQYDFGIFCVIVSAVAFLIAYKSRKGNWFQSFGTKLTVLDNPQWQWRIFTTGFAIGALPILIIGKFDLTLFLDGVFFFQKRWSSPLTRGRYGGIRDAFLELQMFHSAILPIAAVIFLRKGSSLGKKTATGVFLLWMVLKAMNSGARSQLLAALLPVLGAVYFLLSEDRKRMAILFGVPLLTLAGYYWSAAVVVTRNSGDFSIQAAQKADYVGFEMFRELVYINSQIGGTLDYEFGRTYATQLVNPIPRFLWKGKPTSDAGILLARARGEFHKETGEVYLTRSPGMIGEMYWNFGLIGVVLLSAFGGIVVRSWDEMQAAHPESFVVFMVYSAGLAVLFLSGRSFSMPALYGILSLFALMVFFGLGKIRQKYRETQRDQKSARRRKPIVTRTPYLETERLR